MELFVDGFLHFNIIYDWPNHIKFLNLKKSGDWSLQGIFIENGGVKQMIGCVSP